MNITTTTQGFELNAAINAFVRNRLHVALKRLSVHVVAIDVFARDTNGPKGGVDKQVLIRAQLPGRHVLVVETSHENLYAAINAFVRNRLHVALKRLSVHVIAIDVFARDTNGPKGGVDKQVLIRAQLPGRHVLVVETSHENLYAAIERGAKRTKRAVRRHLRKTRHIEKQRLRDLPAASRT